MRLVTIVVLAISALPLTAADPLYTQSGVAGWTAVGAGSELLPLNGGLNFAYTISPGSRNVAYMPVAGLSFTGFQSMRFALTTDAPTPVAIVLSEKKPGGGNYTAVVWSPGKQAQPVALSPADFAITDGPTDPVDTDGILDLDQVESIAIVDLGQFFTATATGGAPFHVRPREGRHFLFIEGFRLLRDPLPAPESGVVDNFSRLAPAWFTPGEAVIGQNNGTLKIAYRQLTEEFVAFLRQLPKGDYAGATHLAMDIGSARSAQLLFSITERRDGDKPGPRYNADFLVFGGTQPDHRELALDAFTLDENGPPDPRGKLDPNNIQSLAIVDVSGESAENTLTLHDLRLVKR